MDNTFLKTVEGFFRKKNNIFAKSFKILQSASKNKKPIYFHNMFLSHRESRKTCQARHLKFDLATGQKKTKLKQGRQSLSRNQLSRKKLLKINFKNT